MSKNITEKMARDWLMVTIDNSDVVVRKDINDEYDEGKPFITWGNMSKGFEHFEDNEIVMVNDENNTFHIKITKVK